MEVSDLVKLGFVKDYEVGDYIKEMDEGIIMRCEIRRQRVVVFVHYPMSVSQEGVFDIVYLNSFGLVSFMKLLDLFNVLKS